MKEPYLASLFDCAPVYSVLGETWGSAPHNLPKVTAAAINIKASPATNLVSGVGFWCSTEYEREGVRVRERWQRVLRPP